MTVFLTIAHRGDPLVHRENTMASFASALDKGANAVEFDLRRTRDGRIVVLHDPTLRRLWDVPAALADLTLAEVRATGSDGYAIPTLDDLLEAFRDPVLLVDLKTDDVVEPAVRELRRRGAFSRAVFVAARPGGPAALLRLRAAEPAATIGLDWTDPAPPAPDLLAALRPQYFGPRWHVAAACGALAMRERGYRVWVGPLASDVDQAEAYACGVDGIVSDDVGTLLHVRSRRPSAPSYRRR